MGRNLLRRIRWGNVALAAGVCVTVAFGLAWTIAGPTTPVLPRDEPRPLVGETPARDVAETEAGVARERTSSGRAQAGRGGTGAPADRRLERGGGKPQAGRDRGGATGAPAAGREGRGGGEPQAGRDKGGGASERRAGRDEGGRDNKRRAGRDERGRDNKRRAGRDKGGREREAPRRKRAGAESPGGRVPSSPAPESTPTPAVPRAPAPSAPTSPRTTGGGAEFGFEGG